MLKKEALSLLMLSLIWNTHADAQTQKINAVTAVSSKGLRKGLSGTWTGPGEYMCVCEYGINYVENGGIDYGSIYNAHNPPQGAIALQPKLIEKIPESAYDTTEGPWVKVYLIKKERRLGSFLNSTPRYNNNGDTHYVQVNGRIDGSESGEIENKPEVYYIGSPKAKKLDYKNISVIKGACATSKAVTDCNTLFDQSSVTDKSSDTDISNHPIKQVVNNWNKKKPCVTHKPSANKSKTRNTASVNNAPVINITINNVQPSQPSAPVSTTHQTIIQQKGIFNWGRSKSTNGN